MKKRLFQFALLFSLLIPFQSLTQDLNLTQFYNAPIYLNPAFTGSAPMFRLATTYRNQWVQIPQAYQSNLVSFDYNLQNLHSGVGVLVSNDRIAAANLNITNISFNYAYALYLPQNWQIKMGLQTGYILRNHNINGFTFGDQIDNDGAATAETVEGINRGFVDIGAGFLMYDNVYWFGASVSHLNSPPTPDFQRLNPNNAARDNPMKLSVHAGAKLPVGGRLLLPAVLYQRQGGFQQLDIGANYNISILNFGLWYRGLPVLAEATGGNLNQEAIAVFTGVTYQNITFGYSYDYNVGTRFVGTPGGSHEISLVYTPAASRQFKRGYKFKDFIECPAFLPLTDEAQGGSKKRFKPLN